MKMVRCIPANENGFCQPEVIPYIEDRKAVLIALETESKSSGEYQTRVIDALGLWLLSDMQRNLTECFKCL